jgi:hypothetical protein
LAGLTSGKKIGCTDSSLKHQKGIPARDPACRGEVPKATRT